MKDLVALNLIAHKRVLYTGTNDSLFGSECFELILHLG